LICHRLTLLWCGIDGTDNGVLFLLWSSFFLLPHYFPKTTSVSTRLMVEMATLLRTTAVAASKLSGMTWLS
jgi:hypothetical protein